MSWDLSLEFTLPASPKRVMQLLIDPVLIRRWSGDDAVLENKEGGRFEMFGGWVTGTVLKTSDKELAYTWHTSDWDEHVAPSQVHYLLKPADGGTLVQLSHTGFPNEHERDDHKSGWADFFFTPLEDYIMVTDKP